MLQGENTLYDELVIKKLFSNFNVKRFRRARMPIACRFSKFAQYTGLPKICIHTLTKENSALYNLLL